MDWLSEFFTPNVLVLIVTALVALGFGLWIGRGTVSRPEPEPVRPVRPGVNLHQLRTELNAVVNDKIAPLMEQIPAVSPNAGADPATQQELDSVRDQLEDVTNDLHESRVTIDALRRRNESLAQAVAERDELVTHLGRQVVGENWTP